MKISKENTVKEIICRTVKYDGGVRPFHWHENIEICQVITNSGNFLVDGCMVEAKKGGSPSLEFARPLIIYEDKKTGAYTDDMNAVYDTFSLDFLFKKRSLK